MEVAAGIRLSKVDIDNLNLQRPLLARGI